MLSTQLRSMSICIATVHTSEQGAGIRDSKRCPFTVWSQEISPYLCPGVLTSSASPQWVLRFPRNQEKWLQLLTDSPEWFWGEFTLYSHCLEVLSHIFSRQSSQSDSLKKKVLSLPVSKEMASFSPVEIRRKGASVLHVCNLIKSFIWNQVW